MSAQNSLPMSHWQRLWLYLLGGLVMLFLIAPSVIIVIMSFSGSTLLQFPPEQWSLRWYEAYFGSVEWRDATVVSVKVAVIRRSWRRRSAPPRPMPSMPARCG